MHKRIRDVWYIMKTCDVLSSGKREHDRDVGVRSPTKCDARRNYRKIPEMYCSDSAISEVRLFGSVIRICASYICIYMASSEAGIRILTRVMR